MVIPLDVDMNGDPLNCTGFLPGNYGEQKLVDVLGESHFSSLNGLQSRFTGNEETIRGNRLCEVNGLGGLNSDQFTSEVGGDSSGCDTMFKGEMMTRRRVLF
ncbi:hypothetical protein TNCV_3781921 [Trichonephila clavipes]|nr:hypothetical protein TNCV_3781921 [Trichonephila clavipes]